MPNLHTYGLFVSHAWDYNEEYYRLLDFLMDEPNFQYVNYSVPEHDPIHTNNNDALAAEIQKQMRPAEVILVISGLYVAHSDWIQYEIDVAKWMKKPIIGIKPWGSERIPQAVQSAANQIVGWNATSIATAIRQEADRLAIDPNRVTSFSMKDFLSY